MFIKKNIFAVAIFLATVCQMQAHETAQDTNQEITKQLTEQQQSVIATIITQVVDQVFDAALDAVTDVIQVNQTNEICLQDAITLLQSQANNLVDGSTFELNGVHYTVHTHKTMEIVEDQVADQATTKTQEVVTEEQTPAND
jgi:hypothetical protein